MNALTYVEINMLIDGHNFEQKDIENEYKKQKNKAMRGRRRR